MDHGFIESLTSKPCDSKYRFYFSEPMVNVVLSTSQQSLKTSGVSQTDERQLRLLLPVYRKMIFWTFQFLFWSLIGVAVVGLGWHLQPETPTPWIQIGLRVFSMFVVSTLVYFLFAYTRLAELPRLSRWLLIVVVAILSFGFSLFLIVHGFNDFFREEPQANLPYVPRMVTGVLWCSIYFALELISDLYNKELQLADSKAIELDLRLKVMEADSVARAIEVRQLQEQLNPHFLFNALNAVAASKNDPELVENVTRDLADYLRFTLGEARTLEPLSRELQALEKYLGIQQARFGENLDCRILCDRAAHSVLVPPMLIQPLLENALNYGAKTSDLPLRVEVSAKVTERVLEVIVSNTGRWIPPDHSRSPSTGIRSLRKRLMLICSEHATVDLVLEPNLQGGWVRVVVHIPVAQGASPLHLAQDDNHSGVAQDSLVETK